MLCAGSYSFGIICPVNPSVSNKQLPTCLTQVKFAGGKLIDWEGCPLDKLKFLMIRMPYDLM